MSAVLNHPKLETIFDHGVTDEEQLKLFGFVEPHDEYIYSMSQDYAYGDIYNLLMLRGNNSDASLILNKLTSERAKSDLIRIGCCDSSVSSQLLRDNPSNALPANN